MPLQRCPDTTGRQRVRRALLAAHPGHSEGKFEAIAAAQAAGRIVADIRPDEVYSLVIALAGTWSPISATYTAVAEDPAADHAHRRAALRAVVDRALVVHAGPA